MEHIQPTWQEIDVLINRGEAAIKKIDDKRATNLANRQDFDRLEAKIKRLEALLEKMKVKATSKKK